MILNQTYFFDDIISNENQNKIIDFFETNYDKWFYLKNVVHQEGMDNEDFPGYTTDLDLNDNEIIGNIILEIQTKILNELNLKIAKNRRYKLNALLPPSQKINENDLYKSIHYDTSLEHLVILYYVNDSDGDTKLFKNKLGNNYQSNVKVLSEIKSTNFSNLELIESFTPKKGTAIVFDGSTFHCPGWPTTNNRYTINFNIFINPADKKFI